MIALLALAGTAGLVLALWAGFRRWVLVHRAPGEVIQELVRPRSADAQFWCSGVTAVVCVMTLLIIEPAVYRAGGWWLVVAFAPAVFETAGWASGFYRFAFYEGGLWYGRSWYPYHRLRSLEVDRDRVSLVVRGRTLTFRTQGSLAPEIRLKVPAVGFS